MPVGQLLAHLERHFAVHPDLHPAVLVEIDHAGVRLDVPLVLMLCEGMLKDVIGGGKPHLDIALLQTL